MAAVLESVPHHEMPESLAQRMESTAEGNATATPHAQDRITKTFNLRRLTMKRVGLLTVSFAFAAWLAFFVWLPGGRGIAVAALRQALERVKIVHITGLNQGAVPLEMREDKWFRAQPFAMYEETSPADPKSPMMKESNIIAGDADRTYWYFPKMGNKVYVKRALGKDFVDMMMSTLQPSPSSQPDLKITGHAVIEGRQLDLLDDGSDQQELELAVDPRTNLTYRIRQFNTAPNGTKILITDLRVEYDQTPPKHVFDWQPPAGATVVQKKRP
jgi:hypothetical protein